MVATRAMNEKRRKLRKLGMSDIDMATPPNTSAQSLQSGGQAERNDESDASPHTRAQSLQTGRQEGRKEHSDATLGGHHPQLRQLDTPRAERSSAPVGTAGAATRHLLVLGNTKTGRLGKRQAHHMLVRAGGHGATAAAASVRPQAKLGAPLAELWDHAMEVGGRGNDLRHCQAALRWCAERGDGLDRSWASSGGQRGRRLQLMSCGGCKGVRGRVAGCLTCVPNFCAASSSPAR